MNVHVSRPTAILAGISTVTLGGILGSLINTHSQSSSDQKWIFFALVANFLFQIYREYRAGKVAREEQKAKEALAQRINSNMRTRLTDLSTRLDKILSAEEKSFLRRRAGDLIDD